MGKLTLFDTLHEILRKLSEGNLGALSVLIGLIKYAPDDGLIQIMKFDDLGIYGPLIWLCFKDMLDGDFEKLYKLLKHNKLMSAIKEECESHEYFNKIWNYEQYH